MKLQKKSSYNEEEEFSTKRRGNTLTKERGKNNKMREEGKWYRCSRFWLLKGFFSLLGFSCLFLDQGS